MRCIGGGSGGPTLPKGDDAPIGAYLQSYDPEANGGRGMIEFTDDIDDAKQFPGMFAAVALWQTVPTSRPRRADGKPNKPLTAFTMEFLPVRLDEEGHVHEIEPGEGT